MLDSHGRNINYLRVSVTDSCNLRCIYCMPEKCIERQDKEELLNSDDILKVVKIASTMGIKKVRYTGGEPLIFPNIDKLIYETSKLETIKDISITTNGILLNDMLEDLHKAGLKRANISLDTLNKEKFKVITRGGNLDKVFSSIERCLSLGISPIKINTVVMRGINDNEIEDFIRLTKEMPVEVRFIELMPIGEGAKIYEKSKMSLKEIKEGHPELVAIKTDKSTTAEMYKLNGAEGKVGFISPLTCKFCADCNKIRLTSAGTIKPCLHSEGEISIKEYLNNDIMLTNVVKSAILNKPLEHHLEVENISRSAKMMYQVGG